MGSPDAALPRSSTHVEEMDDTWSTEKQGVVDQRSIAEVSCPSRISSSALPSRSASVSRLHCSRGKPSPLTNIIILPRRAAGSSDQLSDSQSVNALGSPANLDIHVKGVPFLSDGYHRVWDGTSLVLCDARGGSCERDDVDDPTGASLARVRYRCVGRCSSEPLEAEVQIEKNDSSRMWALLRHRLEVMVAIPQIASAYVYLLLHLSVVLAAVYWVYRMVFAFRRDIQSRVLLRQQELMAKAKTCEENYTANRCFPEFRVPALATLCAEWEVCMHHHSTGALRETAMSAEILGHVIHSFFEQFSCKSVLLLGGSLVIAIIGSYYLSFLFRKGPAQVVSPYATLEQPRDLAKEPAGSYQTAQYLGHKPHSLPAAALPYTAPNKAASYVKSAVDRMTVRTVNVAAICASALLGVA